MDLCRYIAKRFITLIPVLLGITIFSFFLGVISPGDPAEEALASIGIEVPTTQQLEDMREQLGLNDGIAVQYTRWLSRALQGDLGTSYFTKVSIKDEFMQRIPVTLKVSLLALTMTIVFGVGMGAAMTIWKDTIPDKIMRFVSVLLLSIPGFWLAILMIIIFSEQLHWLPTSGNGGFLHMLMPAFVLASSTVGSVSRMTRSSIVSELGQPYMTAAKSKGLSARMAAAKHAFINSLLPVVTLVGNYFGGILGGTAIVETIFSLRGMGSYVLQGISSRDYPIVQAYVLYAGTIYVLVTLAIDLLYVMVNPKIRLNGGIG